MRHAVACRTKDYDIFKRTDRFAGYVQRLEMVALVNQISNFPIDQS